MARRKRKRNKWWTWKTRSER